MRKLKIRNLKLESIMEGNKYIKLGDLEIYKIAIELSDLAWEIFKNMEWYIKKNIGGQFLRAIDSIGANIAEGYGRYHYNDKIKFFYNSRGSLLESKHWTLLLSRRNLVTKNKQEKIIFKLNQAHKKLNAYIRSYYK